MVVATVAAVVADADADRRRGRGVAIGAVVRRLGADGVVERGARGRGGGATGPVADLVAEPATGGETGARGDGAGGLWRGDSA